MLKTLKIKCTHCNKTIKNTNTNIIKFIINQSETNSYQFNNKYICDECFDENDYVLVTNDILKIIKSNDQLSFFIHSKNLFVNKKEFKKYLKLNKLHLEKNKRIQLLIEKLLSFKLSYNQYFKYNICESYVNHGDPDLETVIKKIYEKQSQEDDRLCELLEKLESLNLQYDHTIPAYKKFIKKGGDVINTIESGELEKDLITTTNYLLLCDETDSDTAKEIAIGQIDKKTKTIEKYIAKKNTIKFD